MTVRWAFAGLAVAIALCIARPALAATVQSLSVDRPGDYYHVVARLDLPVARDAAFHAATEFRQVAARSSMIESMRRVDDNRLVSRMHLCVMWYCKTVHQVMRYRTEPPTRLDMQVVPGMGDLKAGAAHWRFLVDGPDRTTLVFTARLIPDFWVPPLIGPWAIARALRQQIASTAEAIEQIAGSSRTAAPDNKP